MKKQMIYLSIICCILLTIHQSLLIYYSDHQTNEQIDISHQQKNINKKISNINKINQINQIYQINSITQIKQINTINQMNTINKIKDINKMNKKLIIQSLQQQYLTQLFQQWKLIHNKIYQSEEQNYYRLKVFINNSYQISIHNLNIDINQIKNLQHYDISDYQPNDINDYTLALNQFSDLTHQQYIAILNNYVQYLETKQYHNHIQNHNYIQNHNHNQSQNHNHIQDHNHNHNHKMNKKTNIEKKNNQKENKQIKKGQQQYLTMTNQCTGIITTSPNPPTQLDWSKKIVTPVIDQGKCGGASYAISAVGAVQGSYALKSTKLQVLSIQQVLDCSGAYGNEGCDGGFMDQAFWYLIDYGLAGIKSYPNKFTTSKCSYTKSMKTATFTKCADVPSGNYLKLLSAVIQQPTSVAIDASQLQHYSNGIYTGNCSSTSVNQAMLIVGYGVENNLTYWKVKNSFGVSWGQDGYLLLEREEKDGPGKCGVHLIGSVPQGMV